MNLYCVMLRVTGNCSNAEVPNLGALNSIMTSSMLVPSSSSSPQSLQRDGAGHREKLSSAEAGGQLVGDLGIFLNRSTGQLESGLGSRTVPFWDWPVKMAIAEVCLN